MMRRNRFDTFGDYFTATADRILGIGGRGVGLKIAFTALGRCVVGVPNHLYSVSPEVLSLSKEDHPTGPVIRLGRISSLTASVKQVYEWQTAPNGLVSTATGPEATAIAPVLIDTEWNADSLDQDVIVDHLRRMQDRHDRLDMVATGTYTDHLAALMEQGLYVDPVVRSAFLPAASG